MLRNGTPLSGKSRFLPCEYILGDIQQNKLKASPEAMLDKYRPNRQKFLPVAAMHLHLPDIDRDVAALPAGWAC